MSGLDLLSKLSQDVRKKIMDDYCRNTQIIDLNVVIRIKQEDFIDLETNEFR